MTARHLSITLLCMANLRAEINVKPDYEEIAERGKVLQYAIEAGTGTYCVAPPPGWQLEVLSAENSLVFRHEGLQAVLSIKFSGQTGPRSARELRLAIEQRFPGATSFEHFTCTGRDTGGPGLNAQFAAADGSLFQSRTGIFQLGRQTIELSLLAPVGSMAKCHAAWIAVVNSLRQK